MAMFDDVKIPEPPNLYVDFDNRAEIIQERGKTVYPLLAERMARGWRWRGRAFDLSAVEDEQDGLAKAYQHYLKHYLGTIHSLDRNIGRMLDFLEKKEILDDTLVIYTTDNGMFLGEHGWHDKRLMYEESIKVPFVARYPNDIKSGTVTDAMSLNLDFAPTFLDYAGASIPTDMQGVSLRPVFQGKTPPDWRQSMFYAYYEGISKYGVRTKRYKLMCYSGVRSKGGEVERYGEPQYELFDIEKDPLEINNVIDDPAYAQVRKKLEEEMLKLRRKYNVRDEDLPGNWEKRNRDTVMRGHTNPRS